MEEYDDKIGSLRNRLKGSIAIGIVDNTILDDAAPLHRAVGALSRANKDIMLTLDCRAPNDLLRELIEGRLDVAIGSFPKMLLGLTYLPLYEERHGFYCGEGHALFSAPERDITQAAIARYAVIARGYWGSRDVRALQPARPTTYVNNMEAAARLILSGVYVGYLPVHYGEVWVKRKQMRVLLPDVLSYAAPFEVAFTIAAEQRRPVKVFVQELQRVFKTKT